MKGILKGGAAEIKVKNSRFLAETFPAANQEEARALIKAQKDRYPDARHVVHAFVIGPSGGILGCSDDGEPSGTAGRPVLDVLKGSGITGMLVTVTRWFGGTLLGTGGLVKAYGDAAKAVLEVTSSAELISVRDFSLSVSYEQHDKVRRALDAAGIAVTSEDFDSAVTIRGWVPEERAEAFAERIVSLTAGRARPAMAADSRVAAVGGGT